MLPLCCPQCGSTRLYRDGQRYPGDERRIQRWLCRDCSYRFGEAHQNSSNQLQPISTVDTQSLNRASTLLSKRQVCELLTEESKNLTEVARQETASRGHNTDYRHERRNRRVRLVAEKRRLQRNDNTRKIQITQNPSKTRRRPLQPRSDENSNSPTTLERRKKSQRSRCLQHFPQNGWRQMGTPEISRRTQNTIHPNGNGNRPTNSRVQHALGNFPPTTERNRNAVRRSLEDDTI